MATVKNFHIAGLVQLLFSFKHEIERSVSSGVHAYIKPDIDRLKEGIASLKFYKANAVTRGTMEAPHWHSRNIEIPEWAATVYGENLSASEILMLLEIMYYELVRSQSKDLPNSLFPQDSQRFDKLIVELEAFVQDYVEAHTPFDRPEAAASEVSGN